MAEVPAPEPQKTRHEIHIDAARRKDKDRAEMFERKQRAETRVRAALDAVAHTPAGLDLIVWLFHLCGYNASSVVTDSQSGEILERATDHNEARRSVYIDIRKKLDPELRAKIELLAETPFKDETPK